MCKMCKLIIIESNLNSYPSMNDFYFSNTESLKSFLAEEYINIIYQIDSIEELDAADLQNALNDGCENEFLVIKL